MAARTESASSAASITSRISTSETRAAIALAPSSPVLVFSVFLCASDRLLISRFLVRSQEGALSNFWPLLAKS